MQINKSYLALCIVIVILLCVAQVLGSTMLILPCLAVFLVLVGWSCSHNFTLPILLFFLPWSPVLRTSPLGYSFFTFGLILVCGVSIIKKRFKFRKYPIVAGILLLLLTLISKVIDGTGLAFDYIAFIMLIVLFPVVKGEWTVKKYDFYQVVVFFSLGIIIAALCALNLVVFPSIARYIRVDSFSTITRRSGFYGDANFYTAQITAALGGCLTLVLREKKWGRSLFMGILLAFLLYCGFLSASKSFIIVSAIMIVIWIIALLRIQGRKGMKIVLLVATAGLAIFVATSAVFRDLIAVVTTRFSYAKDLNSLTTGRTGLWRLYLDEILSSPKIFFLGKGFTNVKVEGRAPHNTLIQSVFQFGFIGVPVLIYWIGSFYRGASYRGRRKKIPVLYLLITMIGAFMPWLAVDALFFDEFFLLQWYVFCAIQQLKNEDATDLVPVEDNYGRDNQE